MCRLRYALLFIVNVCAVALQHTAAQTFAERIVGGFSVPTFATHAPGDAERLFVGCIWDGDIQIVDLVSRTILSEPFLSITDLPSPLFNEQGLLGLAFDPNYQTNGYFYVNFTASDNSLNVRRYRVLGDPASSNVADPNSGQTVIRITKDQSWHNGGWIGFGPNDGYLYITTGDPGGASAQDLTNNLHGKILRIDVRDDDFPDDPTRSYSIPLSNPFVGRDGDDEIWSYGLRNPWRASFDRLTGDLWINDVGELAREEVNFQPAQSEGGENYGWPRREGMVAGPPGHGTPPSPEYSDPIYDYPRQAPDPLYAGTVIAASGVYRGPVAAFYGHYLFTDFGSGNIWKLDPDAIDPRASVTNINQLLLPDAGAINRVASFGEDATGNLHLMDYDFGNNGEVFRIATTSTQTPVLLGDYSGNDAVDAADYAVWRNTLGDNGTNLAADGTGPGGLPDGVVDQFDYELWRANFGKTIDEGTILAKVPEPSAFNLGLFISCMPLCRSRGRIKAAN